MIRQTQQLLIVVCGAAGRAVPYINGHEVPCHVWRLKQGTASLQLGRKMTRRKLRSALYLFLSRKAGLFLLDVFGFTPRVRG